MADTENTKKFKFGWKEVVLCVVLAAVIAIFAIVFTGNTATVVFVTPGGRFDSSDGAKIYDYDYYVEGDNTVNMNKYHEVLEKTYRISAIATLPEPERDGYHFVGWFTATVQEDGTIVYTDKQFGDKSVKELDKDEKITVYAKWEPVGTNKNVSRTDNILSALDIMWKGMLGIFIVITFVYLSIIALNGISKLKNKKKFLN